MSMDWSADDLERTVLAAAREAMEANVLMVAQEVKDEMGAEASNLMFTFERSDEPPSPDHQADLGTFRISGVPEEVAARFHAILVQRLSNA